MSCPKEGQQAGNMRGAHRCTQQPYHGVTVCASLTHRNGRTHLHASCTSRRCDPGSPMSTSHKLACSKCQGQACSQHLLVQHLLVLCLCVLHLIVLQGCNLYSASICQRSSFPSDRIFCARCNLSCTSSWCPSLWCTSPWCTFMYCIFLLCTLLGCNLYSASIRQQSSFACN